MIQFGAHLPSHLMAVCLQFLFHHMRSPYILIWLFSLLTVVCPNLALAESSLFRYMNDKQLSLDEPFSEWVKKLLPYEVNRYSNEIPSTEPVYGFATPTRSLQRAHCGADKRRRLIAVGGLGELFLGHCDEASETEVISYNPRTGENDFFIIEDHTPGRRAKIVRPNPQLCMSCHQGGNAIFSGFPWDNFEAIGYKQRSSREPEEFDTRVRSNSAILQKNRIYASICGEDILCRLIIADLSLRSHGSFRQKLGVFIVPEKDKAECVHMKTISTNELQSFQKIISSKIENRWPQHGYGYISDVIPDIKYDLPSQSWLPLIKFYSAEAEKSLDPSNTYRLIRGNGFSKKAVRELEHLADPIFPRPQVGLISKEQALAAVAENKWEDLFSTESTLFGPVNVSCKFPQLFELTKKSYRDAMYSDEMKEFVKKWPRFPEEIAEKVYQIATCKDFEYLANDPYIPSQIDLNPPKNSQNLFVKNCVACHASKTSPIPTLPLNDLNALKKYKTTTNQTILDYLKKDLMPPKASRLSGFQQDKIELIKILLE